MLFGVSTARAECTLNFPIDKALAENNQQFAQICNLGWTNGHSVLPCPLLEAPTVWNNSEEAQSVVMKLTVPAEAAGAIAIAIFWQLADANYNGLWTYRSVQSVPAGGFAAGTEVRFGLPGLSAFATHYIRAAYEQSNGKKSCWSLWASVMTDQFQSASTVPALSSGHYIKVQDDFNRRATDPIAGTGTKGDGLGPTWVWFTGDQTSQFQSNHLKIATDETSAYSDPSGVIRYLPTIETNHKTFAQIKVRRILEGPDAYNFSVQARASDPDPQTGVIRSYNVKLVDDLRGCTNPTLIIFKLPSEPDVGCVTLNGVNQVAPGLGGGVCTGTPPLNEPESNGSTVSKPVWLRIEVENDLNFGDPVIRAQAYWLDSSGALQTCGPFLRTDTDDPDLMVDVRGRWGAIMHEKKYLIDQFLAGDGTP